MTRQEAGCGYHCVTAFTLFTRSLTASVLELTSDSHRARIHPMLHPSVETWIGGRCSMWHTGMPCTPAAGTCPGPIVWGHAPRVAIAEGSSQHRQLPCLCCSKQSRQHAFGRQAHHLAPAGRHAGSRTRHAAPPNATPATARRSIDHQPRPPPNTSASCCRQTDLSAIRVGGGSSTGTVDAATAAGVACRACIDGLEQAPSPADGLVAGEDASRALLDAAEAEPSAAAAAQLTGASEGRQLVVCEGTIVCTIAPPSVIPQRLSIALSRS
eukprot:359014-Chlamydomonas_euryale.AAC.15